MLVYPDINAVNNTKECLMSVDRHLRVDPWTYIQCHVCQFEYRSQVSYLVSIWCEEAPVAPKKLWLLHMLAC